MGLPRALLPLALLVASALAGCITTGPAPADPSGHGSAAPVASNRTHDDFAGRLVCGIGLPSGTSNPCFAAEDSRNVFAFGAAPGLQTLLVGLRWDATTTLGDELQVLVESRGFDAFPSEDDHRYGSASGKSDLVIRVDAHALGHHADAWANATGPIELQVRVFPARTMPPSIILDQHFEVHVAMHHGAPAPADASPFPADE